MTAASTFDATELQLALNPALPGVQVEVLDEVDSTNSWALKRGAPALPCLVVAHQQTRGRGRLGRTWHSERGASLTFTLALPLAPQSWDGLSLAVGLALALALEPETGQVPQNQARLMLKWPNDLWLVPPEAGADAARAGQKLGGVLIETAQRGTDRLCVVGVGLNLHAAATVPVLESQPLHHGYAGLHSLLPGVTAAETLNRVALPLALALKRFETQGFAPLVQAFLRRDLLQGQAVTVSQTPPLQGVAEGVDSQGALLLRSAGALRHINSGEVSVRLQAAVHSEVG